MKESSMKLKFFLGLVAISSVMLPSDRGESSSSSDSDYAPEEFLTPEQRNCKRRLIDAVFEQNPTSDPDKLRARANIDLLSSRVYAQGNGCKTNPCVHVDLKVVSFGSEELPGRKKVTERLWTTFEKKLYERIEHGEGDQDAI